jgi:hypothetical protein
MLRSVICSLVLAACCVGCSPGEPKGSIENKDKPVPPTKKSDDAKPEN